MSTIPNLTVLDNSLPANVDAEKTILGAILLDNEAFYDEPSPEADDFSLDSHRRIYRVMTDILFGLCEGASTVDIVTLAHELNRRQEIEQVGGVAYLASLTEGLPRRPVVDEYVRIIREKSMLRRLMACCSVAISRASCQTETALNVLGSLEKDLAELTDRGVMTGAVHIGTVTAAVEEAVMKARSNTSERTALEMTTGIEEWDQKTKGLYRGEFSVCAAEGSGGKTALACQITYANAKEDTPVLWFSKEMPRLQLTRRFYALISDDLTANHMRDPRLMNQDKHLPAMRAVSQILSRLPIEIDDTSQMRIDTLKKRVKMWRRKWRQARPDITRLLVIVDYMQLIKGPPRMSPQERAEYIVFTLRDLPKEEPDIHILALSQYSQGEKFIKGKKGPGNRSNDSMFWGSIVNHAAQGIYKLRIEDPEDKPANALLDAEIRVDKQREGRKTIVKTMFDRDHLKFGNPQPPLR